MAAVTVLGERYLLRDDRGRPAESTGEMMDRVATCVAAAEDTFRRGTAAGWAQRFSAALRGLEFLPNSPTLMNEGTDLGLLSACFVLPVGDRVARTGGTASGSMSFLRLFDTAAGVISMGGRRRGASMAVLDVTHPDIYDFIGHTCDF